jgi:hypothetical protein
MAVKANQKKTFVPVLILIAVLLVGALALRRCRSRQGEAPRKEYNQPRSNSSRRSGNSYTPTTSSREDRGGLNRNPTTINYSKHARCRMQCRHISESEVREILNKGTINYKKSDLKGSPCSKRYAVEGRTHDDQRVRIIFAPCNTEETVVTVIDLGKEWTCDCD